MPCSCPPKGGGGFEARGGPSLGSNILKGLWALLLPKPKPDVDPNLPPVCLKKIKLMG